MIIDNFFKTIKNDDDYFLECSTIGYCPKNIFKNYISGYENYAYSENQDENPTNYVNWFSIFLDTWGWYPFIVYYPKNCSYNEKISIIIDISYSSESFNRKFIVNWTHEKPGLCETYLLPLWKSWIIDRSFILNQNDND